MYVHIHILYMYIYTYKQSPPLASVDNQKQMYIYTQTDVS